VYLRVLPLLHLGFRDEHYPDFADPRCVFAWLLFGGDKRFYIDI
jgi:hypothetical protein